MSTITLRITSETTREEKRLCGLRGQEEWRAIRKEFDRLLTTGELERQIVEYDSRDGHALINVAGWPFIVWRKADALRHLCREVSTDYYAYL